VVDAIRLGWRWRAESAGCEAERLRGRGKWLRCSQPPSSVMNSRRLIEVPIRPRATTYHIPFAELRSCCATAKWNARLRFGPWSCQNTSRRDNVGGFLGFGLYSDRGHQRLDAHDIHYPSEIVSEHVECYLGGNFGLCHTLGFPHCCSNDFEFVDAETFLRPTSDVGELCLIEPSFDTSCATIR
jgi:hypothetical protein